MSHPELQAYLTNMHMLDAPLSQLSATALTKDINTLMNPTKNTNSVLYLFGTFITPGDIKLYSGLLNDLPE
jgi:hypothetical protein